MKMFNKIAAALLSVLTVASMGIVISASATNYDNPTDQYGKPYNPNTADTSWLAGNDYCRPKFNDSSIYVKNVSMIYGAYVDVRGRASKYGSDYAVSINGHSTSNVYLPANRAGEIYQGINEHRNPQLSYAHVYFKKPNGSTGATSGVWSPDCAGSYSPLNKREFEEKNRKNRLKLL